MNKRINTISVIIIDKQLKVYADWDKLESFKKITGQVFICLDTNRDDEEREVERPIDPHDEGFFEEVPENIIAQNLIVNFLPRTNELYLSLDTKT